jgi:hypothetical protein
MNQPPSAENLNQTWRHAASEFVDWGNIRFNESHGLTSVALGVECCGELWANPGFEKGLDADLRAAGLGHLDSDAFRPGSSMRVFNFYFKTGALGAAIEFCRGRLDSLGLLKRSSFGVLDPGAETFTHVALKG